MGIFAFLSRLFRGEQNLKTYQKSQEDRKAEASIAERNALKEADRAEAALNEAVRAYKKAEQEGKSKTTLVSLEGQVKRTNASYAAALQALRSRGTNLEVVEEMENNALIRMAAGISVTEEELDRSVKQVVDAREQEEEMKHKVAVGKRMVQGVLEDAPQDIDRLLHADRESPVQQEPQQVEEQSQAHNEQVRPLEE